MHSVYLSCSDVANMTGVKKRTVWGWIRSGKLRASRPGGRNYVVKREDLEAFMEADNGQKNRKGADVNAEQPEHCADHAGTV